MPVMVHDEQKAIMMHHMLYEKGFHLVPITYPGVKKGEERLRTNITRGHTYEEMRALLDAITELGEACEILHRKQPAGEART
jgi:glycine C-acetyltransferase